MHSTILHSIKAAVAVLSLSLMFYATSSSAKDISVDEAWPMIESGAVVIDVRTSAEYDAGHIDNAINIPFEDIVNGVKELNLAKDTPIILYCRSGRRSGIADTSLTEAGYTQSFNAGGFEALTDELK